MSIGCGVFEGVVFVTTCDVEADVRRSHVRDVVDVVFLNVRGRNGLTVAT